jgi:hypothetical protein
MAYELEIDNDTLIITDQGDLVMPEGFDEDTELALVEIGESSGLSIYLYWSWNLIKKALQEEGEWDNFINALAGKRRAYDYDGFSKPWEFSFDDVEDALVTALKYYIEQEDEESAIEVANIINTVPWSFQDSPYIDISDFHDQEDPYLPATRRDATHKLVVKGQDIAEWEHTTVTRVSGYYNFDFEQEDYREHFDDLGAPPIVEAVLKVFELEDEPDYPDEWPVPEEDTTGEGLFGLMYETMGWGDKEDEVEEVRVIIYEAESEAKEALWMAKRLIGETGENIEVTLVRRRTPSEEKEDKLEAERRAELRQQIRLFNGGTTEDVEEPEQIYLEWRPLEKDWQDRPEDFEG